MSGSVPAPSEARRSDDGPFLLAGLPLSSWSYALRIWTAMMVALYAAFWLQLDSASSAAVTVGILAQPRRGQALQKAFFRFCATIVGVAGSILIGALCSQSRDLLVVAFAAAMALGVYVASLYDGARAYGVALSAYTIAIVAIGQIDSPQQIFLEGVYRLAVITVGIVAIALINDVFAAPEVYTGVQKSLDEALPATRAIVGAVLRGEDPEPDRVLAPIAGIVGTRLEILTLPSEGSRGRIRGAAAASAAVAMIASISAARGFAVLVDMDAADGSGEARGAIVAAMEAHSPGLAEAQLDEELASPARSSERVTRLTAAIRVVARHKLANDELAAMREGTRPRRSVDLPIHRDRQNAVLNAVRVFCALLTAAVVFIKSDWPATSVAFLLVGVIAGLSSTAQDARTFAKGAAMAIPLAVVVAGFTEFVVLDGADQFPLLAIGMAPAVFGSCFMSLERRTAGTGTLLLVFVPVIFAPSNPQSYSPQTFVYDSCLTIGGALLLAGLLYAYLPVSDRDRRRWLLKNLREDLLTTLRGSCRRDPAAATYLGADRIVQLSRLKVGGPAAVRRRLSHAMLLSDLLVLVAHGRKHLDAITGEMDADVLEGARRALARLDADALVDSADAILARAPRGANEASRRAACAVADLILAARLATSERLRLRALRAEIAA